MWTTRSRQVDRGFQEVILSRDDGLTFVISSQDWWTMSATEYLANEALRENGLDFKISELYGPRSVATPLWTTEMVPWGDGFQVRLLRGGEIVAFMSLDEWAALPETEYIVNDAVEMADGFSAYGSNMDEVNEALKDELL